MSNIRFKKPKFSEKRPDVILVQDRVSKTSKHSLRPALRARRITPWSTGVKEFPPRSVFINFGGGALPVQRLPEGAIVLNPPDKVALSANKLRTFELLKAANVPHVKWTVDKAAAAEWIGKDHKVLARLSLSSSSGRGIRVCGPTQELVDAPLYTRYFPKTHEFRVHVVGGKAIDITEKKIKEEYRNERDKRSVVRSYDNGWVHAHGALAVVDADADVLRKLGEDAVRAVGLDFGAVDVLASLGTGTPRKLVKAVVCEVNSAPGIENEATKNAYVSAFNEIIAAKGAA